MQKFDEFLTKLINIVAMYICGGLVLVMVLYASANVFARYVLKIGGVVGAIDYIGLMVIPLAFLSLAYVFQKRSLIRVDIISSRTRGKTLWGFNIAWLLLLLIISVMLLYSTTLGLINSYRSGALAGTAGSYMPQWPWKLTVPVGFLLLVLRTVLDLIKLVGRGPKDFIEKPASGM